MSGIDLSNTKNHFYRNRMKIFVINGSDLPTTFHQRTLQRNPVTRALADSRRNACLRAQSQICAWFKKTGIEHITHFFAFGRGAAIEHGSYRMILRQLFDCDDFRLLNCNCCTAKKGKAVHGSNCTSRNIYYTKRVVIHPSWETLEASFNFLILSLWQSMGRKRLHTSDAVLLLVEGDLFDYILRELSELERPRNKSRLEHATPDLIDVRTEAPPRISHALALHATVLFDFEGRILSSRECCVGDVSTIRSLQTETV